MSVNQRLLLVLVILSLAGGGAALWWTDLEVRDIESDRPSVTPVSSPTLVGGKEQGRQDAILETGSTGSEGMRSTTVAHPLEVKLTLVQPGGYEDSRLPAPRGDANAGLRGFVRGNKNTGIPTVVTFVSGPNEGRVLESDSAGHFGASDLFPGLSMVRVAAATGQVSEREVSLHQLGNSELNLDMSQAAGAYVSGTVVDLDGEPLEGAQVYLDGANTLTNLLGEFDFSRVTPGKVPVTVRKDGYALSYQQFAVTFGRAISRDKLTLRLHPGCDLEVRLESAVGSPGPAKLYVLPVAGQSHGTGLGARTFPWHEINPVEVHPGGTTLIKGLQEGHVSLLAFHPGAIATQPIVNKKVNPGARNQHLVSFRSAPNAIRGVVKNADGTPAKNAFVRLEAPTRSFATTKAMQQRRPEYLQSLIAPHLPAAIQEVRTGPGGRFVVTAYPEISPGGYYLSVQSEAGDARAFKTVEPVTADHELTLEPVADVFGSLEVRMGGRYQALGVKATINGQPRDPWLLPADEQLVVQDLEPGLWKLEVWWHHAQLVNDKQIQIKPDQMLTEPLVLPLEAIEGEPQHEPK
ncbi:MAG: carboxypeptidase-like regulatory domain-containing protein [Planctomycetota bacterium]|nr:carboxypeptidase-like regulatory domain-containing protein [Planctomycetota bacterium]